MQISHRLIQNALKKALAPEEVWLERPFPKIGRIADVVWPAQNLIFEVQCSPLSAEEVRARNAAYAQVGFTVIWILHDRCFNHTRLTAAEHFLRGQPHYFTNINALGHGEIYAQSATTRLGRRVRRSLRHPIQFDHVLEMPAAPKGAVFRLYRLLFNLLLEKNTT